MSRGNRKEIQSLSLLGHWLKSCLFQQWPKLITIQACCSVTNSMWKELVASEAGAHCRQPQQKDQGFGWTLNMNFSSALGIGPCPSHIPGAPAVRIAWIDLGLGSSPCPCLTSPGPSRGPVLPQPCPALQPRCSRMASCHQHPCPPRSVRSLPPLFLIPGTGFDRSMWEKMH